MLNLNLQIFCELSVKNASNLQLRLLKITSNHFFTLKCYFNFLSLTPKQVTIDSTLLKPKCKTPKSKMGQSCTKSTEEMFFF